MSELALTLCQQAQIGDRARSDFVLSTLNHLPGAVVRGAFAAAWIAAHGEPCRSSPRREEFLRLFEGGVRFAPLFADAEVNPLSVLSHKYGDGQDCQVAEFDGAARRDVPAWCPDCGSPLEHRRGLRGRSIQWQRRTSVAIGHAGVARRGQIVTRDTLDAGQEFCGTLLADDPALLDVLAALGPVRVGGRRTTHGAAEVQVRDSGPPPTAERRDDGRLIIRLRSPGIFVDEQGRPRKDPDPGELQSVLGSAAKVVHRWTRWHNVGGWHIASGLPKAVELAVAAGSTYVVDTGQPVPDDVLAALGERGLGLRRHEGFGDLAPAPQLRPGRAERDAEARRLRQLLDSVAPLRGVAVVNPQLWPSVVAGLTGHAAGEQSATQSLQRIAEQMADQYLARAVVTYLGMDRPDAAYVARELTGA
jgi:CRISPR-associated protein Csx10